MAPPLPRSILATVDTLVKPPMSYSPNLVEEVFSEVGSMEEGRGLTELWLFACVEE
jgi:hypothetical protein